MIKKLIYIGLFFFVVYNIINGQDISFGFVSGETNSGINNKSNDFYYRKVEQPFGLVIAYSLNKHNSFRTGLILNHKGYYKVIVNNYEYSTPDIIDYTGDDTQFTISSDYITVPFIYRPYIGQGFKIYLNTGLFFSKLIKATSQRYDNYNYDKNLYIGMPNNNELEDITNKISKYDLGFLLGIGIEWYIFPKISIGYNLNYEPSLIKLKYDNYNSKNFLISNEISLKYALRETPRKTSRKFSLSDSVRIGKSSIYLETLGNTNWIYSLNYSHTFKINRLDYYYITFGFAYNKPSRSYYKPSMFFPLSVNSTRGLYKHFLETGLGVTYLHNSHQSAGIDSNGNVTSITTLKALYSSFRIGYKYQKKKKGIYYCVGLSALLRLAEFNSNAVSERIIILPGLRIGYYIR